RRHSTSASRPQRRARPRHEPAHLAAPKHQKRPRKTRQLAAARLPQPWVTEPWVGRTLGGPNPGWAEPWVGRTLGGPNPGWAEPWVREPGVDRTRGAGGSGRSTRFVTPAGVRPRVAPQ